MNLKTVVWYWRVLVETAHWQNRGVKLKLLKAVKTHSTSNLTKHIVKGQTFDCSLDLTLMGTLEWLTLVFCGLEIIIWLWFVLMKIQNYNDYQIKHIFLDYHFRTTLARWRASHLEDKNKEQVKINFIEVHAWLDYVWYW